MRIAASILLVLVLIGLSACRIGPTASDRPLDEQAMLGELQVEELEPYDVVVTIDAEGVSPSAIAVPRGPVHLVIENKAQQSRTFTISGEEMEEQTASISAGQNYTMELILPPGIYEFTVTGGSGGTLRGVITANIPNSI
ncbi:MAG: cupredoxin domain-containing protein [Chloroflexi bacterium]|nr:cupredoxin domain-containing protein [Chloroflexota bacterium]